MKIEELLAKLCGPWLGKRPFADRLLCHFLRRRLQLPAIDLAHLFHDFEDHEVFISRLPKGGWSTPLADIVILLKIARCANPSRLLEIGSFRGYTTRSLAEHTNKDARLVAVDRNPNHGEAYQRTAVESKIERRVGEMGPALFSGDAPESYDLIFIDADHRYEGVQRDTELVLPLVAPYGYIIWHDYANWGYFNGYNGVPEYLNELSLSLPIAHIYGSDLAIHSPAWNLAPGKDVYESSLVKGNGSEVGVDPWQTDSLRG